MVTSCRVLAPEQLHVTLAFLGEVDDGVMVDGVHAAMRDVARNHVPFTVNVAGGGVFPDWRRPRVVWLGLQDSGALSVLGDQVTGVCATLGFPMDRGFRAHLTIGRMPMPLRPIEREALKSALGALTQSHPFDVTRVILMRSDLGPGGSTYSELASYDLGPA